MKKVQLPLGVPPMRAMQFYAYPLVILAQHEEAWPWIHSNYIQLCFYKNFEEGFVVPFAPYVYDYATNPMLTVQRIQREMLAVFQTDIVRFAKESLDLGHYVYLNIDQFYIPRRNHYQRQNFAHDILVFGYDEEAEEFEVLGFREDFQFAPSRVSYAEFEAAYRSLDVIENWSEEICLYRLNPKPKFQFDPKLLADRLEEYLLGTNTSERFYEIGETYDRAYGMQAYPYLKKYFQALMEDRIWYDVKYTHVLWEHKRAMTLRLQFLEERGDVDPAEGLLEAARQVEQQALTFKNIFMRVGIDHDLSRLSKIVEGLDSMAQAESELLERLIAALRR